MEDYHIPKLLMDFKNEGKKSVAIPRKRRLQHSYL
jgi:hypothetical protein